MAYEIVPATEARLAEVEAWLNVEEAAYSAWEANDCEGDSLVRGFRCNWDSVKRRWREGYGKVDILVVDDHSVGFLDGTDILEIRPDLRGKGYGCLLADFMLKSAYDDGRSLIEIEIAPRSARPFWENMGFTSVEGRRGNGGGLYAFKIFPRTYQLTDGKRSPYSISFYTNDEAHENDPTPFVKFSGLGEALQDGSIQLPERAYCFENAKNHGVDAFVRIELDGQTLHFDKVKREESKRHGLRQDKGYVYYIDRITPAIGRTSISER